MQTDIQSGVSVSEEVYVYDLSKVQWDKYGEIFFKCFGKSSKTLIEVQLKLSITLP